MTPKRMDQLRLYHNFTGLEKSHTLMECLDEIERLNTELEKSRVEIHKCPVLVGEIGAVHWHLQNGDPNTLQADRDHWRTEYKTLELAGEELRKQRDQLVADKQRLTDEIYRLRNALSKVTGEK